MMFREERGIGYCGLACALCGYDDGCPGCKVLIAGGHNCSAGICAADRALAGCYACPAYDTCQEGMQEGIPHGKRSRVFSRYAREFGERALLDRLRANFEAGITYHTPDKSPGNYDRLGTEDEIYQLLRYGRNDPYEACPEFDTEHFHLRQVREEDAEELLCFYGDLRGWMFYGNDMSNSIFASDHATAEEMRGCIRCWLDEYKNRVYVRCSVIDKVIGKAIGTIEIFDNYDNAKRAAALHIDLSSPYETREYIAELLSLADKKLFALFDFKYLIVRAVPDAAERIAALSAAGYQLFETDPGREHYYIKRSPV